MSRPRVLVDGKEYVYLAVTSVVQDGKVTHFVHAVDPKTHQVASKPSDVVEIQKLS